MDNKVEIDIEIRTDVLEFITAKAERYGCNVDELIENYFRVVASMNKLPFDSEELAELLEGKTPPLICDKDLAANYDKVLDTIIKSDNVMYIWHDGEVKAVIMMKEKYDRLINTEKKAGPRGAGNET